LTHTQRDFGAIETSRKPDENTDFWVMPSQADAFTSFPSVTILHEMTHLYHIRDYKKESKSRIVDWAYEWLKITALDPAKAKRNADTYGKHASKATDLRLFC
jgi:hypothetical protein